LYGEHNILIEDIHSICVLDERDTEPEAARRYKAAGGKTLAFSADGLHWDTRAWEAVGKNDTGTSVVKWQGRYLAYVRQQESHPPDWPLVRAVGLTESEDFVEWTPKRTILQTDEEDGFPWTQPYGLTVFPCGDVLVGLLWMIVLDRVEEREHPWKWNNRVGDIRTELVVSRDGKSWERVAGRQPFLEAGSEAWERARAYPGTSVLTHGERLWFYYSGTEKRHGEGSGRVGIGLATSPAERLVGLVAEDPERPGELVTPPLQVDGEDLLVNAETGAGHIQVELQGEDGSPIPGSGAQDCRLEPRDPLRFAVRWGERPLAAGSSGAPVRLRVVLTGEARLYAFQVR
jgi:hypothetical protein